MRQLILIATISLYSPAAPAFLDSLGISLASTAIWEWATSQDQYRAKDYESPVEQYHIEDKSARHCDPFGGCRDYVSTTVVRKVREYKYHWRPEWDEWEMLSTQDLYGHNP